VDGAVPVGSDALVEMTRQLLTSTTPGEITRASLARHANVDPALIRYYFKNRDSLMRAAAEALTQKLSQRGALASERPGLTPAERISSRAEALLAFKIENPFFHRLMIDEMALSDDKKSRALFRSITSAAVARYAGYIKAGCDDGSLRDLEPGFLYMAVIGLCDFFVIASPALAGLLGDKDPAELQRKYSEFICDLLLNGIRAR